MQFITKNGSLIDWNVGYCNKPVYNISNLKLLGLATGNIFSWKTHVDMIIPELSAACFAVTVVKRFMSQDTLRMIYHSCFHSTVGLESCCTLRLWYVDLVVSTEVAVEVWCCFTVFSC
jgi:hypothetical protein